MESLSEYLIEAVAKRSTGKYNKFPDKPDKDEMIEFLESNGFRNNAYEGKSYWVGPCEPSNRLTFWIKFIDYDKPKDALFFYRFKYLNQKGYNDFTVIHRYPNSTIRRMTMEEFKR